MLSFTACGVETDSSDRVQSFLPTDGNGSVISPDSNGSTTPGTTPDIVKDPVFDIVDAKYDDECCSSANTSANPLQNNAGDERETFDTFNGMKILSLYNETTDDADSNVVMYYNNLLSGASVKDSRSNIYGDNSQFIVTYDLVWVTQLNNTVYVKTPKLTNELPSCFRMKLDNSDGNSITPVKVYR